MLITKLSFGDLPRTWRCCCDKKRSHSIVESLSIKESFYNCDKLITYCEFTVCLHVGCLTTVIELILGVYHHCHCETFHCRPQTVWQLLWEATEKKYRIQGEACWGSWATRPVQSNVKQCEVTVSSSLLTGFNQHCWWTRAWTITVWNPSKYVFIL